MKTILSVLIILCCVQSSFALQIEVVEKIVRDDRLKTDPTDRQTVIESRIKNLNSDSYSVRTAARRQLVEAGNIAIPALLKLVEAPDVQLSFVAVEILKEIALTSDLDTLEMILKTSNELSDLTRNRFRQWSVSAIDEWKSAQIKRAVSKISKLGATVSADPVFDGLDMILLTDLDQQVKTIKRSAPELKNVLAEIQELRNLQEGKVSDAQDNVKENANDALQEGTSIVVVNGRRLLLDRAGRMIDLENRNDDSRSSGPPQNVVIGNSWTGNSDDLRELRMMFNLGKLEFVEKNISEDYLDAILKLPTVKSIAFTRCKYSMNQVREFKEKLDRTKLVAVTATGEGYLGVYGPNTGEPVDGKGSFVSMVSPDSAALEAGLKRGDIIFKVDEDNISSFSELSLAISSKQVGKPVRLMIRRNETEKEIVVKLKSREGILR